MPALVAGIHVFVADRQQERRGWPGISPGAASPATTPKKLFNMTGKCSSNRRYYAGSSFFSLDDDAIESLPVRRQLSLTIGKAIGRKDVSDDVGVALHTETTRAADWHLARSEREKGPD